VIIDHRADYPAAMNFEVVDLDTGQPPVDPATGQLLAVWYANDQTGVYLAYEVNADGSISWPLEADGPKSRDYRGRIAIVPRPFEERDAGSAVNAGKAGLRSKLYS
jgi:hypothetical protein